MQQQLVNETLGLAMVLLYYVNGIVTLLYCYIAILLHCYIVTLLYPKGYGWVHSLTSE